MINLTTAATEKVKADPGAGEGEPAPGRPPDLRPGRRLLRASSTGWSSTKSADGDQVFEKDGIKVIVDPMSMRYLEGAEVDYKEDLMGGGFAIKNPNATSTCGCGHSFQAGSEGGGADAGHGHQH